MLLIRRRSINVSPLVYIKKTILLISIEIIVSAQIEPRGIPGRLLIEASSSQFYSQGSKSPTHKHKLPLTISTELTLMLVNFVEAYPPQVVLWNRPTARTTVQLRGGSGHFYVDAAESGKNVNIEYIDDGSIGTTTKTVELRPLRTGALTLPVFDLCIQGHQLNIPVSFLNVDGLFNRSFLGKSNRIEWHSNGQCPIH